MIASPVVHVCVAASAFARIRGLLARPVLRPGFGLLLLGESRVHGVGMRHALDLAFLDRQLHIIALMPLLPGQCRSSPGAYAVLELRAGDSGRLGLTVGMCPSLQLIGPIESLFERNDPALSAGNPSDMLATRDAGVSGSVLPPTAEPVEGAGPGVGRMWVVWLILTALAAVTLHTVSLAQGIPSVDHRGSPPGADARMHPGVGLTAPVPSLPQGAVPGRLLSGLLRAAEDRYQRGDLAAALADFRFIAEASPVLASRAWLRVGNILQRQGDRDGALSAYRRAVDLPNRVVDPPSRDGGEAGSTNGVPAVATVDPEAATARRKALGNLALVALDIANDALAALGPLDAEDPMVAGVGGRLEQAARALPSQRRVTSRGPVLPAVAEPASTPAARPTTARRSTSTAGERSRGMPLERPVAFATDRDAGSDDGRGLPRIEYDDGARRYDRQGLRQEPRQDPRQETRGDPKQEVRTNAAGTFLTEVDRGFPSTARRVGGAGLHP